MKIFFKVLLFVSVVVTSAGLQAGDKFTQKRSPYNVSETLDRLESVLKKKGITVFARVDHKYGAKKAGLQMQPTQLLIFGNPKMGTPLMNENPLMGLDLPMKALAWEDKKGQVWLAYTNPSELQRRHKIKNAQIIKKMTAALDGLTNKAIGN